MPAENGDTRWLPALAVHVFTASGAALALFAAIAAVRGDFVTMFWWLGAALFVDGIDGTFARRWRIAETLPRWSGETLDFVVDFATYVFVPAFALVVSGLLPPMLSLPLGAAIVVGSAIYFADREMKTDDNCFRGFPALWNAAAFYIFLWRPEPAVAAAAVVVLTVMMFLPVRFVHPFRVVRFRAVTICVLILWAVLAAFALLRNLEPGLWITLALTGLGLYFLAGGIVRNRA